MAPSHWHTKVAITVPESEARILWGAVLYISNARASDYLLSAKTPWESQQLKPTGLGTSIICHQRSHPLSLFPTLVKGDTDVVGTTKILLKVKGKNCVCWRGVGGGAMSNTLWATIYAGGFRADFWTRCAGGHAFSCKSQKKPTRNHLSNKET